MLRSLLVPLDGSQMGEWSLPLATRVARSVGAELHLAHVHVPYEPDQLLSNSSFQWEGVDMWEYDRRHRRQEDDYLHGWEERIRQEGATVDTRVLDDGARVIDGLVGYADEVGADLIVMTSHGRSGLRRALWGSVADAMIRKTAVPVLVIHPDREDPPDETPASIDHILVPLDGSPLAESVLGPTTEVAKATGAKITLTHVVPDLSYLGPRILGFRPDRLEPALEGALALLEPLASDLRKEGFDATVHPVVGGEPSAAIAALADELEADLIAIATHGYGGAKRTLVGSVTDRLLGATKLPLLVVRPPEKRHPVIL